jgi:hypothetical protein
MFLLVVTHSILEKKKRKKKYGYPFYLKSTKISIIKRK